MSLISAGSISLDSTFKGQKKVRQKDKAKNRVSGLKSIAKIKKCKQEYSLCWSKRPYLVLRKVQVIVFCSLQIIVALATDHDGHDPLLQMILVTDHGESIATDTINISNLSWVAIATHHGSFS
jgi:hypothetical protein